ncbi:MULTISPECIES: DUF1062 domain-containing protein [unclassified Bosea (in: a-proteobacteria)]|uniref:DUF1062 domain-containing protein n=1 Tax=unclassified Bosea (in: a-proteobacteria) TaxID=2653178 RepID=UPI000F765A82|nr:MULTISPECIES: DUF1062 domain-containing protein [unclassified Bosea (in: a-proteobacteria)]AZO80091.1 hypothetical protein BLM15_22755 [Bosea sp. Tri-49]RXT22878.1 hypothetical protein B5U98_09545 [Bosea sp. Tri-39]RXT38347.1 hypothetical protein B5U99_08995 [Bosea sp. Tri-54]
MCNVLRVRWTIVPLTAPQPRFVCSGCGGLRAFQSSGKIRLNANGRKLDAWLIYKCSTCEQTWNRPIFERRNVRDIDPLVLEALQSNDLQWIQRETFNLEGLRRDSPRVDEFSEFKIEKDILLETANWTMLELELMVPFPIGTRLDRLLASELKISRARLQTLHDGGTLRTNSDRADILRRRVKTDTRVTIDLSTEADRGQLWRPLATGGAL